jgi:signal transduction histidine kinase
LGLVQRADTEQEVDAIPAVIDEVDTRPVVARRQILIVDDQEANLTALEAALAPLERPIAKARSGTEALAQLLEKDVSLVLLDVQMPDMDGFETAALIRNRERTKHLPIIFITAQDRDQASVLRAYKLGAVDFLFKPIDPEILVAKASVFVTLQDKTEELATERLQREFDLARRDYETQMLRRQNGRKDAFLAILSHELRNPLAPIRTAIDMIKLDPERPVPTKTIDILDRQTDMLARLVEDLLDVARINANKIELRPEHTDLRTVINAAIDTSRPAIDRKHHTLTSKLPDKPVPVIVDAVRMVQVVTNLLQNAARYTEPNGSVAISLTSNGQHACVRVTDSGVGIPADLLPSIFDMFVQERVRSDGSGGLGLGLALANQLVRMHHGSIRAASPGRGEGSTFEVQLPLATAEQVLAPRRRSESIEAIPKPVIGGLLTLVVDDNDDARELLADMLKSHGYDVITAVDGKEGLALIRDQRPDVALIDLGLPGLDGYTLARQLRSECPDLTTRLVALTGYGHTTDMERTREAGFAAHVVKPATAAMILEALTTVTA